ncbi:MAG: sulfite exporter TauE/SafE family protein [Alphaproteobacteria bacterium]|nr:sulfite exporter TauE/SafE family protein [Alphaproteobacteria bacterium]
MTTFIVCLIVGLTYAVQSTFGFGAGLISLPFLTLLIGAKASISLNLIFQTCTATLLFTVWKDIAFKKLPLFLACTAVGIVMGTLFLKNVDDHILEIILGFYLTFYALKQLLKESLPKVEAASRFKASPYYAAACGFPGGVISGAFGTGGPMLVSFIKSLDLQKDNLRATILFTMFFCNVGRIIMAWQTNQFDEASFTYALYASPFFLVGLLSGNFLVKRLNDKQYLHTINLIILLAGMMILIKHFAGI